MAHSHGPVCIHVDGRLGRYPGTSCYISRHFDTDKPQNHNTAIRPSLRLGGASIIDKKISLLALIILVLAVHWLLSFFGQSIVPGIPHTGGFIDLLSVVIVVLIIIKFLS
jgi:hypothetical protein